MDITLNVAEQLGIETDLDVIFKDVNGILWARVGLLIDYR